MAREYVTRDYISKRVKSTQTKRSIKKCSTTYACVSPKQVDILIISIDVLLLLTHEHSKDIKRLHDLGLHIRHRLKRYIFRPLFAHA